MIFLILLVFPSYSVELFYKIELCLYQLLGYLEKHLYTKKCQSKCFPFIC